MSLYVWTPVAWITRRAPDPQRRHAWSLPSPDAAPIVVWDARSVPEEILAHVEDTDDMDWVALVPARYEDPEAIPWLASSAFACCRLRSYPLESGWIVVGHHA